MDILQFSSSNSLQIFIAGDSLVSFVFALKAKPKIEIFLQLIVLKLLYNNF